MQSHSREMVHSQGISATNLFIHFLQRGNLTHDLIHLCDVSEMPAALCDTCCIFGPQINNQSQNYWMTVKQTKVAAAKSGNLSFNLQPYIGHFKGRHICFTHGPHVSKNVSDFKNQERHGRDFLVCSTCTDSLKGFDGPGGPIRLPKSVKCSQFIRPGGAARLCATCTSC